MLHLELPEQKALNLQKVILLLNQSRSIKLTLLKSYGMSLQGKIITVTGGGRGIGLATARLLASRGATLSIADSDPATLNEVEKEFQEKQWPALFAVVDVRKRSQVDSWIDETVRKFGRLDAAANIAGTQGKQCMQAPVADIDDEDWELVLGVNLTGMEYLEPRYSIRVLEIKPKQQA